ncbi:MAG: fumarate hydratase [Magnetovibrio sp.]|nr:fumarate hydratase [Magnetovibrio sp.]
MSNYVHHTLFPLAKNNTSWRLVTNDYVSSTKFEGKAILKIEPQALTVLCTEAMREISHLLRPGHLQQLRDIFDDLEASENDRFVALDLLKNANIAAGGILPMCQDTGTAIIHGYKGQQVWTGGDDEAALSEGIFSTFRESNFRYSQLAPLDMFTEINTGNNLPAQIDLYATVGDEYHFLFMAKGGGSANKTFLYQKTKALLNMDNLMKFMDEKIRTLGTAACPPYHLAIVIGGTSAEANLKTVKLASAKYLDTLPIEGNKNGQAFRDLTMEALIHKMTQKMGIGAQFGGKYFCHDVRVIRLPRHGASCPVGIGVSCSADRQCKGKITSKGVFIETLERDPAKYLPNISESHLSDTVIEINTNKPIREVLHKLSMQPVKTRLSISGTLIVARDIAHARLKELLDSGKELPHFFKNYPIYYAGPAKKPEGYKSGSFGPTTAGRMDTYVEQFQAAGGSLIMLAKGNRSSHVTASCKKHGGFYLGSIGGPAARLAMDCIKKVRVQDFEELGMEAIWRIEVINFPAFIVIDNKGNDFYASFTG